MYRGFIFFGRACLPVTRLQSCLSSTPLYYRSHFKIIMTIVVSGGKELGVQAKTGGSLWLWRLSPKYIPFVENSL